ncbi:MAG: heavy-metal-associated domain-containing protein [Ignavibacteriales bacterium]|nr:heavy-metal-associated domain-containing protein [Ignavibacteriales bacterium]
MKRIFLMFVAAILTVGVVTAQLKQSAEAAKADTKVLKTTIKVPTIVCGSCVTTVTNALKKVDGVKTAKVDLKKKTATVTYASTKATVDKLEKAIADAGYDANDVKRNPEAYEKLDACCKTDEKK